MNPVYSKERGVALIIVLLIVAIVSVLATEMGGRLQLQVKRASNIKDNNQAYWYAMGAEQFAQASLKTLVENNDVIHLNQDWNQEFAFPIEGGGIQAKLTDLQACLNLNALAVLTNSEGGNNQENPSGTRDGGGENGGVSKTDLEQRQEAFKTLLTNFELDIPSYDIDTLSDSIVDWIDPDSSPGSLGAEDSEYESKQFPYLAANNLMVHLSELRLINGVNLAWLNEILAPLCVIPGDAIMKINVNTVDEDNANLIAALTGISLSQAQSALGARGEDGFEKTDNFLATPELASATLTDPQRQWFDVSTSHFVLHTRTQYNNATFAMQTVFKIDSDKNVRVLTREFSGF